MRRLFLACCVLFPSIVTPNRVMADWHPLGSGVDNMVFALTPRGGDLIAGGLFTHAGGHATNHVARWDGITWRPLGGGADGNVLSLTDWGGGLVAGGNFSHAGGGLVNGIALWDGTSWNSLGGGMFGAPLRQVNALTTYNGELVAGGSFVQAGGVDALNVARWDGVSWHPLSLGLGPYPLSNSADALTVWNGYLVAGGEFSRAGAVMASNIAIWDGYSWQSPGSGVNDIVETLAVYDGSVIAAGDFTQAGGLPASHIASWDGTSWSPLGSGLSGAQVSVHSLAVYNGTLIVGGSFDQAGGVYAPDIARWDGTSWSGMGSDLIGGAGSGVYALAAQDGRLTAGGVWNNPHLNGYIAQWTDPASVGNPLQSPAAGVTISPCPSRGACNVSFRVASAGPIVVDVVDASGRIVRELLRGTRSPGDYSFPWSGLDGEGRALPSGIYVARITTARGTATGRVVLTK